MSSDSIKSSVTEASTESALITKDLHDYCSLKLESISGNDPVPGSTSHDEIASDISTALQSWMALLQSEAKAVVHVSESFKDTDDLLSKMFKFNLMGAGR
jgi:hypothetical protein